MFTLALKNKQQVNGPKTLKRILDYIKELVITSTIQVRLATSKRNLISSITNLVYELPLELPNDLRLRILGN